MAGGITETANGDLFLLEFREVLFQRKDTGRAKEYQHVIVVDFYDILQVGRNGAEHHGLGEIELCGSQQVKCGIRTDVGATIEVFLVLVLLHDVYEVVKGLAPVEHLALAVLHVTLEIESCRLVDAEILQCFGNSITHFLGHSEEMVDGVTASEDDGSVFRKLDMFLAEFACRDCVKFDELFESNVHAILLRHVGKRRLRNVGRLGL